MSVTAFKNAAKVIRQNSHYICTALSIAGTVGTAVFAAKGAVKATYIIDDLEASKGEPIEFKEKMEATWKCFIPAVALGVLTIGSTAGVEYINLRRYSDLGTLYALDKVAHNDYVKKVKETIGEGKELKIRDEVNKDIIQSSAPYLEEEFKTTGGNVPFVDTYFGTKFYATYEAVERAEMELLNYIRRNGYASVNDWTYLLKLPDTGIGEDVGWDKEYISSH